MSIPGAHGLGCQLLEQRQLFKEVINNLLAVYKGLPVTQGLGQLLGLVLEVVDLLCHGVNLLHNIYPEQVSKATDGRDDCHVQPAQQGDNLDGAASVTHGRRNRCLFTLSNLFLAKVTFDSTWVTVIAVMQLCIAKTEWTIDDLLLAG